MNDQVPYQLTIDSSSVVWTIADIDGNERLDQPWRFDVRCAPSVSQSSAKALLDQLLTKPARLSWKTEGGQRAVSGVVDAVTASADYWEISIVPRVALLADTVDHRVFCDEDSLGIVTTVLGDHGITVDNRAVRSLVPRAMCVQAFESDLDFVSRLLAEEGIAWFCDVERDDVLVLVDDPSRFPDVGGDPIPVVDRGGLVAGTSIRELQLRRTVVSDKASLRDYDFVHPDTDLTAEQPKTPGSLEIYEYPGGYADLKTGSALAQIRLEEVQSIRTMLVSETESRRLLPGYVVTLSSAGRAELNGKWLIVAVDHRFEHLSEERVYGARFEAIPATTPYRPARRPAPKLGGIQTMTITGPSGGDIHTEEHGRIKARFRWDRLGPQDDHSSAWVRVAQPPTSGGFFLPRVGWEQAVGFWGASGDVPMTLGRLHNGSAPPPEGLPGKKVCSAFGTATSPGGGGGNNVQTNDTAGNEAMAFTASKDFNERTENDKVSVIAANDTWTIGANCTQITQQVHQTKVGGAQTYSVGATRTVNVTANKMIYAPSETIAVGGARIFNIGGNDATQCSILSRVVGGAKGEACIEHFSRSVNGAAAVVIGGSWNTLAGLHSSTNVGGANIETVGGAKNIKAPKYALSALMLTESLASHSVDAGGDIKDVFKTTVTFDIGGSATLKGANVIVVGTSKITLKADGVTVTLTDGDIKIDGKFDSTQKAEDKNDESYD